MKQVEVEYNSDSRLSIKGSVELYFQETDTKVESCNMIKLLLYKKKKSNQSSSTVTGKSNISTKKTFTYQVDHISDIFVTRDQFSSSEIKKYITFIVLSMFVQN